MHMSSKHMAVDHLLDPLSCLELEQKLQNVRKAPRQGFLSWERVVWTLYMSTVSLYASYCWIVGAQRVLEGTINQ